MEDNQEQSASDAFDSCFDEAIKIPKNRKAARRAPQKVPISGHATPQKELSPETRQQLFEALGNEQSVERIEDAWRGYIHFKNQHTPRGALNEKLRTIRDALKVIDSGLVDSHVAESISLLGFGTSPSKRFSRFQNDIKKILEMLNITPIDQAGRGKPLGGSKRGDGRPAKIFYTELGKACEHAGFSTDKGMEGKTEEIVKILQIDDVKRIRLNVINQLRKKHKTS